MTQEAVNAARVLYELGTSRDEADALKDIFGTSEELTEIFSCPVINLKKRAEASGRICEKAGLSQNTANFIRVMVLQDKISQIDDILEAYYDIWDKEHNIIRARLIFGQKPESGEVEKAEKYLDRQYPGKDIRTTISVDESLLGGSRILVGYEETDMSYEGMIDTLSRHLIRR